MSVEARQAAKAYASLRDICLVPVFKAGDAGTVDKTQTATTQVSALFGTATPANFSVSGTTVSWTGRAGEWGCAE